MFKKTQILLIENDQEDGFMLSNCLKEFAPQAQLTCHHTANAAIKYLKGMSEPDIVDMVILDLHLGKSSGFSVMEFIRQHQQFSHVIVVVMSNSQDQREINRSYQLGANCFVPKAMTYDELQDIVSSLTRFWLDTCALPGRLPTLSLIGQNALNLEVSTDEEQHITKHY